MSIVDEYNRLSFAQQIHWDVIRMYFEQIQKANLAWEILVGEIKNIQIDPSQGRLKGMCLSLLAEKVENPMQAIEIFELCGSYKENPGAVRKTKEMIKKNNWSEETFVTDNPKVLLILKDVFPNV